MSVNVLDVISALNLGGRLTPFHGLAQVYSRAEIRTALTPSTTIDIASLDDDSQGGSANWVMRLLQPTIVLSGPAGTRVIAPAGEAPTYGGWAGILLLLGIAGVPFALGWFLGKRSRRTR